MFITILLVGVLALLLLLGLVHATAVIWYAQSSRAKIEARLAEFANAERRPPTRHAGAVP